MILLRSEFLFNVFTVKNAVPLPSLVVRLISLLPLVVAWYDYFSVFSFVLLISILSGQFGLKWARLVMQCYFITITVTSCFTENYTHWSFASFRQNGRVFLRLLILKCTFSPSTSLSFAWLVLNMPFHFFFTTKLPPRTGLLNAAPSIWKMTDKMTRLQCVSHQSMSPPIEYVRCKRSNFRTNSEQY